MRGEGTGHPSQPGHLDTWGYGAPLTERMNPKEICWPPARDPEQFPEQPRFGPANKWERGSWEGGLGKVIACDGGEQPERFAHPSQTKGISKRVDI